MAEITPNGKRQLSPSLFADEANGYRGNAPTLQFQEQADSQIQLEARVAELRMQLHSLSENMGKIVGQTNEFIKGSQQKFEKVQQAIYQLDQANRTLQQEQTSKWNGVNAKMNDRKSIDLKVQELIDRHNSVLKTFEVRMNQMQKHLLEKEAQLQNSQATLNEAKMEISRLKRL